MVCPWAPGETRNFATSIYFLLVEGNFSAFHRIKSDEIWHFYEGDPIEVWMIDQENKMICHELTENNRLLVVPANHWFASRTSGKYALAGCTVAPGFDFRDFELADREKLVKAYPQHEMRIVEFTRV
jgi:predicted cupin superfamily sugar epimerase